MNTKITIDILDPEDIRDAILQKRTARVMENPLLATVACRVLDNPHLPGMAQGLARVMAEHAAYRSPEQIAFDRLTPAEKDAARKKRKEDNDRIRAHNEVIFAQRKKAKADYEAAHPEIGEHKKALSAARYARNKARDAPYKAQQKEERAKYDEEHPELVAARKARSKARGDATRARRKALKQVAQVVEGAALPIVDHAPAVAL